MSTPAPKVFDKPVDWDEMYPGRFLKAADFKGKPVTLKIAAVDLEELVGDKGPQVKGVIRFEKTEKQLALNKTNGICMKAMWGRKVQSWVGKRLTLFASVWNGEDCIGVWGSPDIEEEMVVNVKLPKKRPFDMTMHKMGGAAPAAAKPHPVDTADVIARLESLIRGAKTQKEREAAWQSVKTLYGNHQEIPMELDAATQNEGVTVNMRTVIAAVSALLLAQASVAQIRCPDGSYVGGTRDTSQCKRAPDGTYVEVPKRDELQEIWDRSRERQKEQDEDFRRRAEQRDEGFRRQAEQRDREESEYQRRREQRESEYERRRERYDFSVTPEDRRPTEGVLMGLALGGVFWLLAIGTWIVPCVT